MAFPVWMNTVLWVCILAIGAGLVIGTIIFAVWRFLQWKKYREFVVLILEEDEFGQMNVKFDSAGIFVDGRSNQKKFFLRGANVGLKIDDLKYAPCKDGKKLVMIQKFKGSDPKYVYYSVDRKTESVSFGMTEEDLNWGLAMYDRAQNTFEWKNKLLQYAPWMGLVFIGFIFLVVCIVTIKELKVIPEATSTLKDIVQQAVNSKAGTVILP